jgi:hypothetical protein
MSENFAYRMTQGQAGAELPLSRTDIETLLRDVRFKNGFTLVVYMMRAINGRFADMRAIAVGLVETIDRELEAPIE